LQRAWLLQLRRGAAEPSHFAATFTPFFTCAGRNDRARSPVLRRFYLRLVLKNWNGGIIQPI